MANNSICPNCGSEIPEGQYYCPECGVSADGNYILEKEIIYYDKLKEALIRIGGLYGYHKKKNDPLQPYKNVSYQLTDTCPHCGSKGHIVGYQGKGTGRPIYEVDYNGTKRRVAVTVGSNGYIVGANPK